MVFGIITAANQNWTIAGNTIVTYQPTIFDLNCYSAGTCASASLKFEDNIFLGYTLAGTYFYASGSAPGMYYKEDSSVPSPDVTYSLEYGVRNGDCGSGGVGIICSDPLLVGEPPQNSIPPESVLDNFNFHPAADSPAVFAGSPVSGLVTDYFGHARPATPTFGAVEP